jgi:hypothetical protein
MLLLLSKYRMKSLPVVDIGEGTISNIITQAAVVHMLSECVGLSWFEDWGTKTLSELGLPIMKTSRLVKVPITPCMIMLTLICLDRHPTT